jgi:hypothetical protein
MSARFARNQVQNDTACRVKDQGSHRHCRDHGNWARLARRHERRMLDQLIVQGLCDMIDEVAMIAEMDVTMEYYNEWLEDLHGQILEKEFWSHYYDYDDGYDDYDDGYDL